MTATIRKVWLGCRCAATQAPPNAARAAGMDSTTCQTTVSRPLISFSWPSSAISPWKDARTKRVVIIATSMPAKRPQ